MNAKGGMRVRRVAAHLGDRWRRRADPAWLADWHPRPFELPGGFTEVVEMGEGPPLLLLPPLPGYKEAWLACAASLARSFRVITLDLRVRFEGAPRWDVLIEDLERVLDALGVGAAGVVGHSLGGALAQHWALARPERARALVLSSSFARVTTPPAHWGPRYLEQPLVLAGQRLLPRGPALRLARRLAAAEAWVYDPRCDQRVLDFVRACICRASVAEVTGSLRLAWAHDSRAILPHLACPTLLLMGERESPFVREATAELGRLIPGATLAVSPGVGHLHPLSGAPWLVETIAAWMEPRLASAGESPVSGP